MFRKKEKVLVIHLQKTNKYVYFSFRDSSFSGTDSVGSENGDSQTGLKVNGHVSQSKNQSPNSSKISSASGGSKGSSGNRGGTGGDNGTSNNSTSDDFGSRVRNVQSLITSLKAYYENVLEQVINLLNLVSLNSSSNAAHNSLICVNAKLKVFGTAMKIGLIPRIWHDRT